MLKIFKILLLMVLINFLSVCIYSQVHQEWVNRYSTGFSYDDRPAAMRVTGNGDVYITGFNYFNGNKNLVLIKYNTSGEELWSRTLDAGLNFEDEGRDLDIDAEGNVYVAGYTIGIPWDNHNSSSNSDNLEFTYFLIAKYDSDGNHLWSQIYNRPASIYCIANKIKVDANGNVNVAGFADGSGTGYDFVLVQLNNSGSLQWANFYNGTGNSKDSLTSLHVDASGSIYITGNSINSSGNSDYKVIKYTSSGSFSWQQNYDFGGDDYIISSIGDENGNIFITGYSWGGGGLNNPNYDWATIKYDASGIQNWVYRNGGLGRNDIPADISVYNNSSVYVTGVTHVGPQSPAYGRTVIKLDYNGNAVWAIGPNNGTILIEPTRITTDNSGNIYFTSNYLELPPYSQYDYLVNKYTQAPEFRWTQRYGNDEYPAYLTNDYTVSIGIDNSSNVYVTGYSQSRKTTIGNFDIVTIKYTQPDDDGTKKYFNSVQSITNDPEKFELGQNFPNPFNPATKISFSLPDDLKVNLTIYNSIGQIVEVLYNDILHKGNHTITWDANKYSTGLYFYRLSAGTFFATKKMSFIK